MKMAADRAFAAKWILESDLPSVGAKGREQRGERVTSAARYSTTGIANTRGADLSVSPRYRRRNSTSAPPRPPRMKARRTATTSSLLTRNINRVLRANDATMAASPSRPLVARPLLPGTRPRRLARSRTDALRGPARSTARFLPRGAGVR